MREESSGAVSWRRRPMTSPSETPTCSMPKETWLRPTVWRHLVFNTRIKKTIRYAEAPVKGSSVLKYDPSGSAADAYRQLAKEVLNGSKARQHA